MRFTEQELDELADALAPRILGRVQEAVRHAADAAILFLDWPVPTAEQLADSERLTRLILGRETAPPSDGSSAEPASASVG